MIEGDYLVIQYKNKLSPLLTVKSEANTPADLLNWEHKDITADILIKDETKADIQPLELTGDHCVLCSKDIKGTTLS